MSKFLRVMFYILSIILVAAMVVACVKVAKDDGGKDNASKDESSVVESSAETTEEESSVVESSEESSAPESLESSEESSEEESSEVESSEESSRPNLPGDKPIVEAPEGIEASGVDAFFNDSVFVGHSVMVHYSNYVNKWRTAVAADTLGNARFCCTSSFSFFNNEVQTPDTADNVLPKFRGKAYNIEDLPAATDCKRIFIGLMGLNDLGMCKSGDVCAQETADRVIATLEALKENSPEVEVTVLASTYLTRNTKKMSKLNNANMSKLNNLVLDYCNENGIDFVDVATPLTDGDGYLAADYSSDDYCHLKEKAYYIWLDVLRDYASQKQAGSWSNPADIPMFEN